MIHVTIICDECGHSMGIADPMQDEQELGYEVIQVWMRHGGRIGPPDLCGDCAVHSELRSNAPAPEIKPGDDGTPSKADTPAVESPPAAPDCADPAQREITALIAKADEAAARYEALRIALRSGGLPPSHAELDALRTKGDERDAAYHAVVKAWKAARTR